MKKLIILTQCFECGSWFCIEKILDRLADHGYIVTIIGLGGTQHRNSKFKYYTIPYPAFNRYGDITCRSPLLNIIWNLPLIATGFILALCQRPQAVIYNGLATGLTMSPFIRILGSMNIVMYHSFLGGIEGMMRKLLYFLGKFANAVVVNSRGSYRDVSSIIDTEKIVINEHYADDLFFKSGGQTVKSDDTLVVSYVGRVDEDKLCFPLMEAIKRLNGDRRFQFNFAGAGSGLGKVELLSKECRNVKYLGYINKREELKKVYKDSDVLWSFADETYLGMPAVEALACGIPIIVPIYAAIQGNRKLIERGLVPNGVGWLVDTNKIDEITALLTQIQQNGIPDTMKKDCLIYAKERYSSSNVDSTVSTIVELLDKNVG